MCGIAGAICINNNNIPDLGHKLDVMDALMAHRGPDGHAAWHDSNGRRKSINAE